MLETLQLAILQRNEVNEVVQWKCHSVHIIAQEVVYLSLTKVMYENEEAQKEKEDDKIGIFQWFLCLAFPDLLSEGVINDG